MYGHDGASNNVALNRTAQLYRVDVSVRASSTGSTWVQLVLVRVVLYLAHGVISPTV